MRMLVGKQGTKLDLKSLMTQQLKAKFVPQTVEKTIPASVHVVGEAGLMQVFKHRANDDFWKTVSNMQTNVKSKIGCGYPINVVFYAPDQT